jgi:hypothetical protein
MKINIMIIILLFPFILCFHCEKDNSPISENTYGVILNDSIIQISSLNYLESIDLHYNFPDLLNPYFVLNKNDTINVSHFLKISSLNRNRIKQFTSNPEDYDHLQLTSKLNHYIQVKNYIVCLVDFIYGQDIIIWQKEREYYKMIYIYPAQIGKCLYCIPDFEEIESDSFSIGIIAEDEGSLYGGYSYFIIHSDTLFRYKELVVRGHTPWMGGGNPVKGATCTGYFTINFDLNGNVLYDPIFYTCYDENGKTIVKNAASDSLSLYKLYWHGVGDLMFRVPAENQLFKIGEIIFHHGSSYIAIEFDDEWYWTLKDEINL